MNTLIQYLDGKKTYLATGLTIALLIGQESGWWKLPAEIYGILIAFAIACLRRGVNKLVPVVVLAMLASIALFGSGCMKSSLALVVREAKQDPAWWKITQQGWGNSMTIERDGSAITNMPGNRVKP